MPYMAYMPLLTCTTRPTHGCWPAWEIKAHFADQTATNDGLWGNMTYQQLKKTSSKAQVTESWVGCSWQSIYLNKIQTSCNKLILESHKKVLFIVRLTVSGGFSGWTSTPSALTINKSEILTHFSTEIWFFDTQNAFHLFLRGLKNALLRPLKKDEMCFEYQRIKFQC